jgi:hypothetical protein
MTAQLTLWPTVEQGPGAHAARAVRERFDLSDLAEEAPTPPDRFAAKARRPDPCRCTRRWTYRDEDGARVCGRCGREARA